MSSVQLGSGFNTQKGNLGGAFDILSGASGDYTDLGIARRFGGAAAAYSLRDIGAVGGRVVKVRRDVDGQGSDPEEDFSANQVSSGALEDWVNGKLENTLPADVATAAAAYSLRKVKSSYSGNAVRIRRDSDDAEVNVAFDSDGKVSTSSSISVVSGSVSGTTLGDFINGTDAFVHTWYDQAGSNDATKITATNQPKIAESGALLADGIKFNGTSTSLSTGSQVFTTNLFGAQSLYAVCNVTDGASGYIAGSADDDSGGKIGQSIYYYTATDVFALTNGSTATNTTVDRISAIRGSNVLVSFNYNNNNDNTLNQNANQNGYSNGSNAYNFQAGSNFIIGARGGTVQAGRALDGSIQEVIAYTSDQSDNRFKIESNINNYYGLYNNGNDMATDWSDDPTAPYGSAFTSNAKNGYSVDYSAGVAATRARWQFANNVPSGNVVYYSFNASITSGTPAVILKQSDGTSNANSSSVAITNGFNSGSITTNAEAVYFAIGDTEGTQDYSISDFKVSLIARNGFVETWYDQSGNGNNAVQGTANKQPKIVSNGGTHKLEGLPAINFDDATSHCLTSSNYSRSGSDLPLSMMAVFDKSTTDTDYLFAANKSDDDAYQRLVMRSTTFEYGERDDANTQKAGNGGSPSLNTIFLMSAFTGGTTSSGFVNGTSVFSDVDTDLGTQTFDQIDIGANNGDGSSSANSFSGNISELYLFETNLSTDRTTIEREIANHYNITLS